MRTANRKISGTFSADEWAVLRPGSCLELLQTIPDKWHFEHGLHCSRRFSDRYEAISWFTKKTKDYVFNLDPVRVPQKYPAKRHFKGPKARQYSCNPLSLWNGTKL